MLSISGARRPPGEPLHAPMPHLVSEILSASLDDLMAEARRLRRGPARHVLAEGLHPADDALPRRLRLLHLRAAAAPRRARVHDRGRGARDRASRRRARAARRRSSRSATSPSCATGSRARSSPCSAARRTLEYLARCAGRVLEETGLLPHLNPGVMTRARARAAAPGVRVDGDHARDDLRPAAREGRAALGLARQGAGAPARDDPARGRARDPVHERDPDRDRRDPGGADRGACSRSGRSARSTATCGR